MKKGAMKSLITDDRCIKALLPLVKDGLIQKDTFVVCASTMHFDHWHMPKIGFVKILIKMDGDIAVIGTITLLDHQSPSSVTLYIEDITYGLTGNCVAVIVNTICQPIKLYLDISLNGTLSATNAMCEMLPNNSFQNVYQLENVAGWIRNYGVPSIEHVTTPLC